jgi:soluble lytic murein transglycosylase
MALCFLGLLVFVQPAYAQHMQSGDDRSDTVKFVRLVNQGKWRAARDLAAGTRDVLASKIYYWLLFTKNDDVTDYRVLTRFIRQNPDWPGIPGLKVKAERSMPPGLNQADVIAWYTDYPPVTADGVDRYAEALIESGQSARAKTFLADWWATTTLSRDDQRTIFRKYGATYLDRAAHLRRFDAMLLREEYINARALAQVLGPGYSELAEARIGLAQDAGNVDTLLQRVPRKLQRDAGLLFERLRWRRKNDMDMAAVEILNNPPPLKEIQNSKDWWKERHIIIRRLLERRMYESAYLLASRHGTLEGFEYSEAEWLAGWLALRFLKKPSDAYEHFEAMYRSVETPVSKARGAYWAARAASVLGDRALAAQWYNDAARYSTVFYGQLAGQALGLDRALPHAAAPELSDQDRRAFESSDLAQAAIIFRKAGQTRDSGRFLKAFVEHDPSAKAYRYAAEMAAASGDLTDAVKISKDATSKGLFLTAQSYPVVSDKLKGVSLEWALVHAIIRQESMFDEEALSSAGAMGLMQLMPATARETARRAGLSHRPDWLTTNPSYNVRLGSAYLSDLIERYDGSYPLAIAAYNAGPGRVGGWLETFGDPRQGRIDMVDWIEMIPVYETRNYVQRVMENLYVYRLRLKNKASGQAAPEFKMVMDEAVSMPVSHTASGQNRRKSPIAQNR